MKLTELFGFRPRFSARVERVLFAVTALVLLVVTVVAYRRLPNFDGSISWPWLVALLGLGAPATVLVNAAEYVASARILAYRVGWWESVRLTLLASTANLLPLPGAALVRTAALRRKGSTYGGAVSSTAVVGLAWLGTVATIAALLLVADGDIVTATPLVVAAVGTLGVAAVLLVRTAGAPGLARLGAPILLVEVAAVASGALRFSAVLLALGYRVEGKQVVGLVVAGVLAAATGIFPGGLGIREAFAAAISPLVGLSAALGLVATAINRIADYVVLLPLALALAMRRPGRTLDEKVRV